MKNIAVILTLAGIFTAAQSGIAQETKFKVGYTNLEVVLAYLPEMQTANSTLNLFQQKLEEDLATRQKYLESKYNEYLQLVEEGGKEEAIKPMEEEIRRLDDEVKRKAAESEQKMLEKRSQLIAPISDKIQVELKAMAAEGAFDLILNSVDGTGNSIVLFGPEENDLTEALLKRMGVTLPKPE